MSQVKRCVPLFLNFLFPNLPNDIKHIFQVNIYGVIFDYMSE